MTPRRKPHNTPFEEIIRAVLEQDGLTMATPEGLRRRARRRRKRTRQVRSEPSIFFDDDLPSVATDPILEMDAQHLRSLSERRGTRNVPIAVKAAAAPKSAHILSLRRVRETFIRRRELLPETYVTRAGDDVPYVSHATPDVFGSLAHDLLLDQYDPYWVAGQFTHPDFFASFRSVYGPLERVQTVVSGAAYAVGTLLHRIERVEARTADEMRDVVSYVEFPRLVPLRALAGFCALVLFITLPAHAVSVYRSASYTRDAAETAGKDALSLLLAAPKSMDDESLSQSLRYASDRFREADALLTESGSLAVGLAAIVPGQYRTARALLEIGDKTSEAGRLLARGVEKMFEDPTRKLDERFDLLAAYAEGIVPLIMDAQAAADAVDPSALPPDDRETFASLRGQLRDASETLGEISGLSERIALFLGKDRIRTYLLVFQNQTEIRPTGGFMGSVAEITVDRGELKKFRVPPGGTYDIQGQLLEHVVSPKPFHLVNARWEFQDSNWSPDFPTAAKTMNWFWSRASQPTVDGIVAVNASVIERLLEITGPVDLPEYGKTITADNFLLETQKEVEIEYDREENAPKKFIGDLGAVMIDRMKGLSKDEWLRVAGVLSDSIRRKDIQMYFRDAEEEQFAESHGWSGRIKETSGDSLALIEANIAGQKTDAVIEEHVKHTVDIQEDGGIIDTVELTRTHNGTKGDLFYGVRNVAYLRAYVPQGSELLAAEGFERPPAELFETPEAYLTEDADLQRIESTMATHPSGTDVFLEGSRTVFGGWLQLDPGHTQTITLRYRLPFTISEISKRIELASETDDRGDAYLLLLTSQSGKTDRTIVSEIRYPESREMTWSRGVITRPGSAVFEGAWDRDHAVAALITAPSYGE